jgi:hypothetical protein
MECKGMDRIKDFVRDESGGMTVFGLFTLMTCLILGGLALDTARLHNVGTQMQNTADIVGHAAIISRPDMTEAEAKAAALAYARRNMPTNTHGIVVTPDDIVFGFWDDARRAFTPQAGAQQAVQVTVRRTRATANPLPTFLLKFAGMGSWNIERTATLSSMSPACLREGFVSDVMVDMQSNNSFVDGFCIHSNRDIKVSSGNFFQNGVIVSMPNPALVQLPNSGFTSNPGLQDALTVSRYNLRVLERLNAIMTGLTTPGSRYIPRYITNHTVVDVGSRQIGATTLTPGRIHRITCTGNQSLSISNGVVLNNVVVVTNCRTMFGNGARLENAVIATTNTDTRSFNGPNGVVVGRNDNCGTGGGAQLLTLGGMDFASGLETYGAQLIARGNIVFSAAAGGVQGASFVAGGTISGTSNMTLAGCGGRGMEDNFREAYARLVM